MLLQDVNNHTGFQLPNFNYFIMASNLLINFYFLVYKFKFCTSGYDLQQYSLPLIIAYFKRWEPCFYPWKKKSMHTKFGTSTSNGFAIYTEETKKLFPSIYIKAL